MKEELVFKSEKLSSKIRVIKNYIDRETIKTLAREPIDIRDKYFISVGRLEKEKNYAGIIDAFNKIKDYTDVKFLILGAGSQKSEILQKISGLGLQQRILLLDFQNNPYKYMSKAEGLILFSDFEGLPNVVIEAFICKIPVIVSNFPGVEDIVTNHKNGLIVDIANTDELSHAKDQILSNKAMGLELAMNGNISAHVFTNSILEYEKLIREYNDYSDEN